VALALKVIEVPTSCGEAGVAVKLTDVTGATLTLTLLAEAMQLFPSSLSDITFVSSAQAKR